MTPHQIETAERCKAGAEANTLTFPEIVGQLMQAGFERYVADFCQASITYYLPSGESLTLNTAPEKATIPPEFDAATIKAAITEAQQNAPGYTYAGFRRNVMAGGCVGYMVSFIGRRVIYLGRTADIHLEHFPQ